MLIKHFSKFLILGLMVLLAFSVSSVAAQDEIECGDIVEEELDGDAMSFEISVDDDEFININLTSDDFDTFIEVYEDDELVYSDDDGGEGFNSRISLAEEGDFVVVVRSFGGDAEGDFELAVTCGEDCEVEDGELEDETEEIEFEAEEGDTILVALYSDDFDAYLNLLDSDEDVLVSDDDSAGNLNSLVIYEVEDDDDYIAEITSFDGAGEGDFVLIICMDAGDVEVSEDEESAFEFIECGDTVEGTVDNDFPILLYAFEVSDGDEITITMSATDDSSLDSYLQLALDGEIVAENDDAEGVNSEIVYEAEDDVVLVILATRFGLADGTSEGDFELEIDCD